MTIHLLSTQLHYSDYTIRAIKYATPLLIRDRNFDRHEQRNGHSYISICLEKSSVYVTLLVAYVIKGRVQLKIQVYWEFSKSYIESCMTGLIFSINSLREDLEFLFSQRQETIASAR